MKRLGYLFILILLIGLTGRCTKNEGFARRHLNGGDGGQIAYGVTTLKAYAANPNYTGGIREGIFETGAPNLLTLVKFAVDGTILEEKSIKASDYLTLGTLDGYVGTAIKGETTAFREAPLEVTEVAAEPPLVYSCHDTNPIPAGGFRALIFLRMNDGQPEISARFENGNGATVERPFLPVRFDPENPGVYRFNSMGCPNPRFTIFLGDAVDGKPVCFYGGYMKFPDSETCPIRVTRAIPATRYTNPL